jgi:hypothetical protein
MSNKGYMSPTINQFMIGILSRGQWVAKDIVLNSPETCNFNYSVVSKT